MTCFSETDDGGEIEEMYVRENEEYRNRFNANPQTAIRLFPGFVLPFGFWPGLFAVSFFARVAFRIRLCLSICLAEATASCHLVAFLVLLSTPVDSTLSIFIFVFSTCFSYLLRTRNNNKVFHVLSLNCCCYRAVQCPIVGVQ